MTTVEVECYICWSDRTWSDCHFFDVPEDVVNQGQESIISYCEQQLLKDIEQNTIRNPIHVGISSIEE